MLRRIAQNINSINEARKYVGLITKFDENRRKVVGSQKSGAKRRVSNVSPESMTAALTKSPSQRYDVRSHETQSTGSLKRSAWCGQRCGRGGSKCQRQEQKQVPRRVQARFVAASSIRAAASPPANIATESRVSSIRSEKSHETRAHWAVGRELRRIAPCRKQPRIEVC